MKKNLNFVIENILTEEQKKNLKKGLNCKTYLSGHILSVRNATVEEELEFKTRLEAICDFQVDWDYVVLEIEDLEKYEFFYCSGQMENPDTLIKMCKWELEQDGNPSFDYSNFCPICKRGLVQKAPLKVKGLTTKHFTKSLVTPFWLEWIINTNFKKALIEKEITGIEFVPLYNCKDEIITTNMQIKPSKILKDALKKEEYNILKHRISSNDCDCNNFFYNPKGSIMKLKKEIKNELLDFNELKEHSRASRIGMYIISKKMLYTMINQGIKPNVDFEFIPVEFE
ncbi:MAG: hypothetical protein MJ179_02065 [Treponema sp.]|nr:hypothetical protein [Treponema sp.]